MSNSEDIANLRNIGPTSAAWLRHIGIQSRNDLESIGVVAAFLAVRDAGFRPTFNFLWAMAAGLQDSPWQSLTEEIKVRLLQELRNMEG
ncbi:MAG: TfoX/Sxy family protein [Zavarzinella sp.]